MLTIVIDTNLLLHYKQPDQIDWGSFKGNPIELVVPSIVIRELEKAKSLGKTERIRARAGRMISWLSQMMDAGFNVELKAGLRLRFEINEPKIDFSSNNLDKDIQDDVLIAGLMSMAKDMPNPPVIATADLGVKAKARFRGFLVYTPPDTDKIAEEPDPREKELRELRRENEQLKNRQPKLSLYFSEKESRLVVPRPTLKLMPQTLEEIKLKFPLLEKSDGENLKGGVNSFMIAGQSVSAMARERYNENVLEYYKKYAEYEKRIKKMRRLASCRVGIYLSLFNEGSAPATDVDVIITFPFDARIFTDERLVTEPKPPEPPQKPVGGFMSDIFTPSRHFIHEAPFISNLYPREQPDWSFTADENTAHYKLKRLKQGFSDALPLLFVQFSTSDAMKSCSISVELSAAELSASSIQELHLVFST